MEPGRPVILVVPIDKEAPKGRLILPQVQAIRDILDHDAWCLVVKERDLRTALEQLRRPPALVVTDSQAFEKVAADTPPEIPLTSFSILFARFKGDLPEYVRGALAMGRLRPGDARPGGRGLLPPPHRRGHRPGEDPALARTVRGRAPAIHATSRATISPTTCPPTAW